MTQNRSSAVMAQRVEAPDSLDDFPTPPWATRALLEQLRFHSEWPASNIDEQSCWEPACNRGHMVKPLREVFRRLDASDVHDYGDDPNTVIVQDRVVDFLLPWSTAPHQEKQGVDWVISNPPFRLAEAFAKRAFQVATVGVALFVRTGFLPGQERYRGLYLPYRPAWILQFTERVILHKGVLRDPSRKYWDAEAGAWRTPSTATDYCWIVWLLPFETRGTGDPPFRWIAPCRQRLERAGDYPAPAEVPEGEGPLFGGAG